MSFLEEEVPEQFPIFYNGIEVFYMQITDYEVTLYCFL
jgi:hypothetical protein